MPLEWSDSQNIKWRAPLPGYGQSSPVIWNDLVVATSVEGEMKDTLAVTGASLQDGRTLWQTKLSGTQKVPSSHMVSRAAPTPAIDADGVYLFFESGDLVGLDHAGQTRWKRSLVQEYGEFKGGHGVGGSLAQTADALILLIDHDGPSYLLKVNKKTGENIWKTDRDPRVSWSSPLVTGNEILISSNGVAESYDLASGKRTWVVDGIEKNTVASPSTDGEVVLIGSSNPKSTIAIGRDGQKRWEVQSVTSSFGSPLIYRGLGYFVSSAGVVSCNEMKEGKQLWEERITASTWATPLAAGDRIYFFGKDGGTTVFQAGETTPKVLATNKLTLGDGQVLYGVAAVNGHFVIRIGKELICVASQP